MRRSALLVPFLLAGLIIPACSSTPAICSALDEGQPAITASRTAYGDAGGDAATAERMLRQGASEVRTACPEHNAAAGEMDGLADIVKLGSP